MWWVLREAERWPEWWRGVERVTVLAPDERYRIAWRSRVPYELEFDFEVIDLDEPRSMRGVASGALAGTGHWRLFEQDGVTAVLYEWNVETTKFVDERRRARGAPGVRLQPRRRDALGRRGARPAAWLQFVSSRLSFSP